METIHPPKIISPEQVLNPGLKLGTKEIVLKNGETITLPFFHIDRMKLFHGSSKGGIKELKESEETTAGSGVYLSSQKESARGYAIVRSHRHNNAVVYETEIKDVDIVNLSTLKAIKDFAQLFKEAVVDWQTNRLPKIEFTNQFMRHVHEEIANQQVSRIDNGNIRHMKDLAFHYGNLVRDVLVKQGFDGLMAFEGGESGNGATVGSHDSYVIFDPKKVKVLKEEAV